MGGQLLLRRRMMMQKIGGGGLPAGYTQVEYLERTSGNAWINTGFIPDQDNVRAVFEYECNAGGDNIIFGMAQYSGNDFASNAYAGAYLYCWWGGNQMAPRIGSGRHTVEIGPEIKIDGASYGSTTISKTFVGNTSKIALFGLANAANPTNAQYQLTGKIFEFSIYYGDALQMHLIPCRDANNVGYMYDTVSGQILGNSGSGSFSIGPDVTT